MQVYYTHAIYTQILGTSLLHATPLSVSSLVHVCVCVCLAGFFLLSMHRQARIHLSLLLLCSELAAAAKDHCQAPHSSFLRLF